MGPVNIAEDVYWVGSAKQGLGLVCNPYLLVDRKEAVIIDPGSVLDFEEVLANITAVVPIEQVRYCVLHHQDPDFCSAVPLLEKSGARFTVVTHWRAQTLIQYYGVKSPYYVVNQHDFRLVLDSGRVLRFLPTPYLHFPGAIATYDEKTKVLFSSDLFGAFSGLHWSLFADEDYLERMLAFHEHYMPSNDILRPVMEAFLRLDISAIAPQHGSVIRENIPMYIKALRDLECGAFLAPVKKDLVKSGGFRMLGNLILRRYAAIFGKEQVLQAIEGLEVELDQDRLEVVDYSYTGDRLWDLLFEVVLARKGIEWLVVIEPYVTRLSREYDVPLPSVFTSTLKQAEEKAFSLSREIVMLQEINARLKETVQSVQEKLSRCPITGLYNREFFWQFLRSEANSLRQVSSGQNPALLIIDIDNIDGILVVHGEEEVHGVLKSFADLLNALKSENALVFRLEGALFAYWEPHTGAETVVQLAERIRNEAKESEAFIEKITVSVGIAFLGEAIREDDVGDAADGLYRLAYLRNRTARKSGGNTVCFSSDIADYQEQEGTVLLVEQDEVMMDVLANALSQQGLRVITARDGDEAFRMADGNRVDLIISELMLPKMDGFLLRQNLLSRSHTKDIPFVLVSHLKNEDTVRRASALGIEHYLQKPVMLSELTGIVTNKLRRD